MPAIFDQKTVNKDEYDAVILHYSTSKSPFKKYKVYSRSDVKEALIKIFKNKCAYCESVITNHPADVEHFRPKNQVTDQDKTTEKPGYYWLAADWTNLYLSCIDCNRRRYHKIPGSSKKSMLGKLDQFPLSDKKHRWKNHADTAEQAADESARYLIDPCKDDPEEFLAYNEKGLILPKLTNGSLHQTKARESIRVYALQRKGLVDERQEYFLKYIKNELLRISKLKRNLALHTTQAEIDNTNEMINDSIAELAKTLKKDRPYTGMARHFIREFFPELLGKKVMRKVDEAKTS